MCHCQRVIGGAVAATATVAIVTALVSLSRLTLIHIIKMIIFTAFESKLMLGNDS